MRCSDMGIVIASKRASAGIIGTMCAIIVHGQFASPSVAEDIAAMMTIDPDKAAASCHPLHPRPQLPWRLWDLQCPHGYPNQSKKTLNTED